MQAHWNPEQGDDSHFESPKKETVAILDSRKVNGSHVEIPPQKRVWQPFWSTVFKSRNRGRQSVAILKSREKGKISERGREAILESQKGKWQPYQNSEKGSYSHFVLRRKKGMSAVFVEILKRAIAAILES